MKLHKILALCFTFIAVVACSSEDNYSAPNVTLEGGIYDLATKGQTEEKLIPAQSPDGARIKTFEGSSVQASTIWCRPDGTFTNTRLFADEYKLVPEGPFIVNESDYLTVHIPTNEKVNFYLEPYFRLKLTGSLNKEKREAKFNFQISKSEKWTGTLNQYVILYSTTSHVGVSSYAKNIIQNVTSSTESDFLNVDLEGSITGIDLNRPVFIRVAARSTGTNYYNYSEVVELK